MFSGQMLGEKDIGLGLLLIYKGLYFLHPERELQGWKDVALDESTHLYDVSQGISNICFFEASVFSPYAQPDIYLLQ